MWSCAIVMILILLSKKLGLHQTRRFPFNLPKNSKNRTALPISLMAALFRHALPDSGSRPPRGHSGHPVGPGRRGLRLGMDVVKFWISS